MTKVLYDINSLTRNLIYKEPITGINRVVFEVLNGLFRETAAQDCIQITVDALNYPHHIVRMKEEFPLNPQGSKGGMDYVVPGPAKTMLYSLLGKRPFSRIRGKLPRYFVSNTSRQACNFDIFHSPFYPFPYHFNNGTVKILTVHDIIALTSPQYFSRNVEASHKNILSKIPESADYFHCVSEATKSAVVNYFGMPAEKVFVVPLAASQDLFYPIKDDKNIGRVKSKYRIPDGDYLLSLATLEPRKNINSVVSAFFRYVSDFQREDLYLVIAGKYGWGEIGLEDVIKSFGNLEEKLIFTGYVDDSDLASLYSGAMCFLYVSFEEGFGLPPLEAMQCGTPVIASKIPAIQEVVSESALLVDPFRIDEILNAIKLIDTSPDISKRLSISGLSRSKCFSWKKTAQQLIEVYKECHSNGK